MLCSENYIFKGLIIKMVIEIIKFFYRKNNYVTFLVFFKVITHQLMFNQCFKCYK